MSTRTLFQSSTSHLLRLTKPKPLPVPNFNRKMASAAPAPPAGKFEFLVVAPDYEGALEKRMEVRPKHFEGLQAGVQNGFWKMGGAFLDEVPKEGEGLKMKGSCMIAVAESKEEVLEMLKKDIYTQNGVWDASKIQVYPFKCAFRYP